MRKKKNDDLEKIIQELEEARLLALKNESPSAAISASMGKAKVIALLQDKIKEGGEEAEKYKQILVDFV